MTMPSIKRSDSFSLGQLAQAWGVPAGRIKGWVASGYLVPDGPEGSLLFSNKAVGEFLKSHAAELLA